MMDIFRRLFHSQQPDDSRDISAPEPPAANAASPADSEAEAVGGEGQQVGTVEEAQAYLGRLQAKISKLAEEFASGMISRVQFQELFDHYQRERRMVESWLDTASLAEDWKQAATEGRSVIIRSQHAARVLGYSIYESESGMPLKTIGEFELDAELFVPMLSSYRSATKEIFGAGMRSTEIEGGEWLCFVPGEYTTLMTLFSKEPAARQLEMLEELHRLFEMANRPLLSQPPVDPEALALPHISFLGSTG
jgi:hypothetical protein